MIRKALLIGEERHPDCGLEKLRSSVNGNMGFIFATNCQLDDIRTVLNKFRMPAAAKAMQIAQCDLSLPAGPTGMDPSQTAFFQALNIGTKIVKGQIELVAETPVLKRGEKVSPGGAVLLTKLGIKPFEYGMEVESVFQDGSCFPAAVLDVKPQDSSESSSPASTTWPPSAARWASPPRPACRTPSATPSAMCARSARRSTSRSRRWS